MRRGKPRTLGDIRMKRAVCLGALCLLAYACAATAQRDPTFVPADQLQALQAALAVDIPALWSEVSFAAPAERDVLFVDLRLAPQLSSKDFGTTCSAATKSVARLVEPNIARKVRLIREWRVIHVC